MTSAAASHLERERQDVTTCIPGNADYSVVEMGVHARGGTGRRQYPPCGWEGHVCGVFVSGFLRRNKKQATIA
jgi:hypothetical protein